jgi:hypothetical protein
MLNDQLVIQPKLFRGLVDFLALGAGDLPLAGFCCGSGKP